MSVSPQLRFDCRQVRDSLNGIAEFLVDRRDISTGERELLQFDLDRARLLVPELERAVDKRPAVGLLMPLTAAGDLMVSTFAGVRDGRAIGVFAGGAVRLPLLRGLLPPQEKAGLSALVRLSHENPSQGTTKVSDTVGRMMTEAGGEKNTRRADAGVRVELLSLADVILILARAYYAHVKTEGAGLQVDSVIAALRRTGAEDVTAATQTGLAAHHVAAIRIHLEQRFRDHPRLAVLSAAGFWETFAALGPRASLDGRRRLAGLLWGGLGDFDTIFAELAGTLEKLNHAPDVLCPAEAVRALGGGAGEAHPYTILSAGTLLTNAEAAGETLEVRSKFGQPVPVARNILSALAREVVVSIEGDQPALLATVDLVQLPVHCPAVIPRETAATTLGIRAADASNQAPWLARAMMQAKTLYLAEDVATQDLTGLVVHLDQTAPLPSQFAPIVAHWIEQTQGHTPQAREANDTTLFVAVDPAEAQSPLAPLKAFLGTSRLAGWLDRWGTDTAFDNLFILGLAQRAAGAALTADSVKRLPRAGAAAGTALTTIDSSIGHPLDATHWMKHVRDAAVAVDEALNAGDGGIVYLAQSVAAVDYARARRRQITARLVDLRSLLADTLGRFLYATAPDAENDWRHRAALATQARLRTTAGEQRIGRLLSALAPSERECAWMFERLAAEVGAPGELEGLMRRLAALERIDSSSAEHVAGRYAERVMAHWMRGMRLTATTPGGPLSHGFTEQSFNHLIEEIAIAALRTDVPARIASGVSRHLVTSTGEVSLHATRAAMVASDVIAGFLSNLGFDAPWSSRHPRRRGTLGAPLFERAVAATPEDLATLQANRITLQFAADWCEGFGLLTDENLTAARGMRFEETEFRELAELLSLLSSNSRERVL